MTHEQLRQRLALEVEQEGPAEVAERYGFSPTFLHNVVKGEKPISRRLAQAMGFEREIVFRRAS